MGLRNLFRSYPKVVYVHVPTVRKFDGTLEGSLVKNRRRYGHIVLINQDTFHVLWNDDTMTEEAQADYVLVPGD